MYTFYRVIQQYLKIDYISKILCIELTYDVEGCQIRDDA